ncbi:glutathione S-transferase family protein [Rhodoferax sp.]|uniref:glutathione S-transferase family protein n=1 Tax=Rhodoferax sp. TaxID=50421 RepID=UPI0026179E6E|nr:glutathione S-transferase family protein [Rhodoferax sp.]MDD2925965.1 glutathione S-transferase family protein [Rhodoferax sp.]
MITLFHCMSARSFRPLWTLEELGLPYTLQMLPFPPRVLAREFMKVNALGTVPALVDGDVTLTESAAMCHYLATRDGPTDLAIEPGQPHYGPFLNWLHFGEATLTFPQTLILRYGRFEPPERRQPQVVDDYRKWFLARLKGINAPLDGQPYLCGEQFTVADISVGYALMLADHLGLADSFPPAVLAYWQRLQGRAGYRQALAVESQTAQAQGVPPTPAPLAG